jgi:hypothetical protein
LAAIRHGNGAAFSRFSDVTAAPNARGVARMIKIALDAIARTLPFGSVGYENQVNERGEREVWLEPNVVDRLGAMRAPARATAT